MAIRTRRLSSYTGTLILAICQILLPTGVVAQESVVPLQLSFSDPGARSMGFGGAFVALADDATAALANPAGLVQLLRPEVSIEARSWNYSIPFAVGGRVENLPSGTGIDTNPDVTMGISDYDTTGLSFLSVAYPIGSWSFALFRHEYADLKFSGATQGLFGGGSSCCQIRIWDEVWASDLDILSYGLSGAYRLSDRFSIGLGIVYYDAALTATVEEFTWDEDTWQAFFSPNSYLPDRFVRSQVLFVDDNDWTLSGGFLWTLSESWRMGGVYRQGFEVKLGTEVRAGQVVDFGVPPGEVILRATGFPIDFPDIYGLGFVYQAPEGHLTVSFQWDHVEYSDIPKSLLVDDATIDDADELHLGAEYVFIDTTPIFAVRLGAWLEPDHQMRYTGNDPFTQVLLPRADDEIHYSAGLGVATEHFQIDFAVDIADRTDTVSLSAIYNF